MITLPGAILMTYTTPRIHTFRKFGFNVTFTLIGTSRIPFVSVGIERFLIISVGGLTGFSVSVRTGRTRMTTLFARNAGVGGRIQSHVIAPPIGSIRPALRTDAGCVTGTTRTPATYRGLRS